MEDMFNIDHRVNNVTNGTNCHSLNVVTDINAPSVPMTDRNNRAVVKYIDPLTRQKSATSQFHSLQQFTQKFEASAEEKGILSMITRSMTCVAPSDIAAAMTATVGAMRSRGDYHPAFWDVVDAWGI